VKLTKPGVKVRNRWDGLQCSGEEAKHAGEVERFHGQRVVDRITNLEMVTVQRGGIIEQESRWSSWAYKVKIVLLR
jgi:hypothetical protein